MSLCVNVLRQRHDRWSTASIDLCAFIDDGTASFVVPEKDAQTLLDNFKPIIVEVYNDLGFYISEPKTYFSDRFTI